MFQIELPLLQLIVERHLQRVQSALLGHDRPPSSITF
jgi:hypothetical protein